MHADLVLAPSGKLVIPSHFVHLFAANPGVASLAIRVEMDVLLTLHCVLSAAQLPGVE